VPTETILRSNAEDSRLQSHRLTKLSASFQILAAADLHTGIGLLKITVVAHFGTAVRLVMISNWPRAPPWSQVAYTVVHKVVMLAAMLSSGAVL
jgi:hypothetical protein